jgi:MFS family permease
MSTTSASHSYPLGGLKAWIVIFCASLFFFYEFVQMNMFNTINGSLMQAFNIDGAQVSNLSAFYFYADVIFLFPAGIILDHFSTRKLIAVALSLCTLATLGFSFAHSYAFAASMRTLSGIGAAFCFLSAMRLATRWFPAKKMALATGFIVTMAMIGGMVAQTPIAILVSHLGWRHTVFIDGLLGIVFVLIILWQIRDFPHGATDRHKTEEVLEKIGFWPSIFRAWKNPQNWLGGLYTSFLNLPILIIGALWGAQFLIQVNHFTAEQAGNIMMMLFLGTIIGSPVLGWISDAMRRRKLPMIICAIISIILVLCIMYWSHATYYGLLALFLLLGFFTSGQIISYPVIAESNPNALVGTATGWAAVLIMGGGAVGQPLFGWLLDKHWDGTKLHNMPIYNAADYHFAWMVFPIMFFVALIIAFFIKETRCQSIVK